MGSPMTESGYNLFDMLSMMQKAIRRGKYNEAGFAAEQIKRKYRAVMWNRLLVTSSEDCYGVLTKEIIKCKNENSNEAIARAVALLCRSQKSRDACYFSCNFVMASRNPREIIPDPDVIEKLKKYMVVKDEPEEEKSYDEAGFEQLSIFDVQDQENDETEERVEIDDLEKAAIMIEAIRHRDMDMAGYQIDQLRFESRENLWAAYQCCADEILPPGLSDEIRALKEADETVNKEKKSKDEIFISKAAILLIYHADPKVDDIRGDEIIPLDENIDWRKYQIKPTENCIWRSKELPEWVYDCHTLRGKRMGKTDWDMTRTEQDALHPLKGTYFDEASWIYTYEQDYETGVESEEHMIPIREYAKTHPVNPVEYFPY